jgi:hypothetical protein
VLAVAGLLLIVALVYLPGVGGGFIFDDFPNIVLNQRLHVSSWNFQAFFEAALSSPAAELPRPVAMLTFALNNFFTGLDPRPMKITNIAIHLLNVCLAMGLARSVFVAAQPALSLSRASLLGFCAAAWWAVLPINVTAVLFIVQRMESLSHTFVLLGLWSYVYGRSIELRSGRRTWATPLMLVAAGIGVLIKESAALTLLYALVLELTIFEFRRAERRRPFLIGMYAAVVLVGAAVAFAWLLPRALAPEAYAHRSFTLIERLMTEPRVLVDYVRWTLAPSPMELGFFHDDFIVSKGWTSPASSLLSLLFLIATVLMAFWLRPRRPVLALALGWFLCAHLLTATFIPLELAFEHRNYFSSFALCLGLAEVIGMLMDRGHKFLVMTAALALFLLYASTTLIRTVDWSNPVGFAKMEAAKHPASPRATYSLAQSYSFLSKYDPRSPYFPLAVNAFQTARKVPNAGLLPAHGLLILQARSGQATDADLWEEVFRDLSERPLGPQEVAAVGSLTQCAVDNVCDFPADRMLNMYAAAMRQGEQAEILNLFANYALNILGDPNLAIAGWTRATTLRPGEPQYLIALAKVYAATGQPEGSRVWIARLRRAGRFGQYSAEADRLEAALSGRTVAK